MPYDADDFGIDEFLSYGCGFGGVGFIIFCRPLQLDGFVGKAKSGFIYRLDR